MQYIVVEAHERGDTTIKVCRGSAELRTYLERFVAEGDRFHQHQAHVGDLESLISSSIALGRELIEHRNWGIVSVVRVDGQVDAVYS